MDNKFLIAATADGEHLCLILPPQPYQALTREDALILAAYLVALADPPGEKFESILEKVKNT